MPNGAAGLRDEVGMTLLPTEPYRRGEAARWVGIADRKAMAGLDVDVVEERRVSSVGSCRGDSGAFGSTGVPCEKEVRCWKMSGNSPDPLRISICFAISRCICAAVATVSMDIWVWYVLLRLWEG